VAAKGNGAGSPGFNSFAVWVGGGKVHTPHPRSYTQAMPRKMRRAAVRSALSVKAAESNIVVVDQLALPEPKTRLMAKALNTLVGENSALILIPEKEAYQGVIRSTNNLPDAKVLLANYLNIRDLLQYDKLVMPLSVLDVINAIFG
jgi:large subunit ribosomal protein L4